MGRTAAGVRGITVNGEDRVIGMVCIDPSDPNASVLVISEKGMGKRTSIEDYRVQSRGGQGVKTMQVTEKTGKLVAIKSVTDADDLMITTESGVVIRTAADELRVMGRATQGVKIIRLDDKDAIADVTVVASEPEAAIVGALEGEEGVIESTSFIQDAIIIEDDVDVSDDATTTSDDTDETEA
jgi:DNA gyrase subunit A